MSAPWRRVFLLLCLFVSAVCGAKDPWETLQETGEPVKDFAALMSASEKDALVATLRDFHTKTGAGLTVVTVESLEGSDIETFSNRLFNRWGVGEKKDDRGVMFVIAKNDRKMRIECGYGAEAVVPDAVAKRIILDDVTPRFKAGDFPGGIVAGSRAIMARFGYDAGGAPPPVERRQIRSSDVIDGAFRFYDSIWFWVLLFVIFAVIHRIRRGTWSDDDDRWGGGGFGSGGGWGGGSSGGGGGGWSGSGGGSSGGGGASGSW